MSVSTTINSVFPDLMKILSLQTKFPEYRRYDLTGAALKSPQSLAHDVNKAAFIPAEDGIMSRICEEW